MRDATAAARELRRHTLDRNGAIFFEIFVDEPRRAIVTVEAYATSDDILAHFALETFDDFLNVTTVESIELHGDTSDALLVAMSGLPFAVFPPA